VHIVLDAMGGVHWKKGYRCLAPSGRLVMFGLSNAATGKTIWERANPVQFRSDASDRGSGPRATALIVCDKLFTIGVAGRLECLDKKTGKLLWTHGLWDEQHGSRCVLRPRACARTCGGSGRGRQGGHGRSGGRASRGGSASRNAPATTPSASVARRTTT